MTRRIRLTRRHLLSGTSRLVFLLWAAPLVAAEPPPDQEPWSEGSWFDDGTGWIA